MAEEKIKKPSSGLPAAFAVITLVAAGAGAGFVFVLPKPVPTDKVAAARSVTAAPAKDHGGPTSTGHDKPADSHGHAETKAPALPATVTKFRDIAAITTNLAGDKAPWIRLEGGLVYDAAIEAEMAVLTSRITEDFITYLRSVKLQQVSGTGGLQALVEDLNDRARARSNGKVQQFVISGFIIE